MPLLREQRYTVEDYWNLPEGERAELIDGKLYAMAPPSRIHQGIVYQLGRVIGNHIAMNNGSCQVYPAPFAVNLNEDDSIYVEPDLSIICDKNKLTDRGCTGAPDFIVEVVSPSSRTMDYIIKTGKYALAGVREYWIVDPLKKCTTIYRFEEDAAPIIYPFTMAIQVGIYKDLKVTISELL